MSQNDLDKRLAAYRQACRLGTGWLLAFQRADGAIGPVEQRLFYYRVPWTLALMGEGAAASRALDWIDRHMLTAEGAFEGLSPLGGFYQRFGTYPVGCLLMGAILLQRHDMVRRALPHLMTWQDPASGGFFGSRLDRSASAEQELFPTCQAGITLVMAREVEAARQVGLWLKRMWELQPDPQHRLYTVYRPAVGLVTDFDPAQAAIYVTRKDDPWQYHFNGGIAAAFLTNLYLATGEPAWLDLARVYQGFSMSTDECQFQSKQVCKSAWGAGLLYVATREAVYRDWALRLGDWFLEHQCPDGHWENTRHWVPVPDDTINIEITAEFVMHLANMITYLSI